MNIDKLKAAEGQFLQLYPLGFDDTEMVKMGNKHKLPQMIEKCQQAFKQSAFKNPGQVAEDMVKLIGVVSCTCWVIRSHQMRQDKAQLAGHGHPLSKSCNAVLGHLMASLRANWETALYCVVILEKEVPFPANDALYRAVSQSADSPASTGHYTGQSSLVSLFEKPKFRDHVKALTAADRNLLVDAFYQRIHGEAQAGFETMVNLLKPAKLAKWSLISVLPYYLGPETEVFVKPTTAKGVIAHFEVPDLVYHPTPTWPFYLGYQKLIKEMKTHTAQSLKPNNAAFCGFLMMSMK